MNATFFILGWLASSVLFYLYHLRVTRRTDSFYNSTGEKFGCALTVEDMRLCAKRDMEHILMLLDVNQNLRGGADVMATALKKLPPWLTVDGVDFEFNIFNDGGTELRLVYEVTGVDKDSPHYEMFNDIGCVYNKFVDSNCSFLFLREGILSDGDLMFAIEQCHAFLAKNNLLRSDKDNGIQLPLL